MNTANINKKSVRQAAARKGIFTITSLARQFGCSREAIYFALERPSRYPRVFSRLKDLVHETN